jgi:hypothetical protein
MFTADALVAIDAREAEQVSCHQLSKNLTSMRWIRGDMTIDPAKSIAGNERKLRRES